MNPIQKLKARLILDEAVRQADNAHAQNCERYYVMPNLDGRLVVMTKHDLKFFKRKGYVGRASHVNDLIRESFYFTPYRNGDGIIPPDVIDLKRRQYYYWYGEFRRRVRNARWKRRKANLKRLFDKVLRFLHII